MPFVDYEMRGLIALITMNRPERGNALSHDLVTGLVEAHERFRDDPEARVGVVTGAGRFFCAGLDLKEAASKGEGFFDPRVDPRFGDVFHPDDLPKPLIGAVNGWAVGGGMNLVLETCELVVMAEDAKMRMGQAKLGYPVGWGYMQTHHLSPTAAAEIVYGLDISAQRALEMGLVNRVVPTDRVLDAALEIAEHVASLPPALLPAAKALLHRAASPVPPDLVEFGSSIQKRLAYSRDGLEAIRGVRGEARADVRGEVAVPSEVAVTPEMKASIGTRSEPVTWEVEKGEIVRFASAIGDPNPLYSDEAAARRGRYGGIIAPPTFLHAYGAAPLDFEYPPGGGSRRRQRVGVLRTSTPGRPHHRHSHHRRCFRKAGPRRQDGLHRERHRVREPVRRACRTPPEHRNLLRCHEEP